MRLRAYVIALLTVGAATIGALVGLLADGGDSGPERPPAASVPRTSAPDVAPAQPRRRDGETPSWVDRESLRRKVVAIGRTARVGVHVEPLGPGRPVTAGALQSGPAWSTAKVPVVVARLRMIGGAPSAEVNELAERAITASDNEAAQRLFDQLSARLGGTGAASRYVTAVLRDSGDVVTSVNSRRIRPEFSTFGQTEWRLARGTRFFAALERGCVAPVAADRRVLSLMRHVTGSQRWGIGSASIPTPADVAFKGGWGPGLDGRYLVRQFGVIRTAGGGGVAIGLMASATDGSFESSVAVLDELAVAVTGAIDWRRLRRASGCGDDGAA